MDITVLSNNVDQLQQLHVATMSSTLIYFFQAGLVQHAASIPEKHTYNVRNVSKHYHPFLKSFM